MTVPDVDPAVHIQVLEQVARGSQLPGIADRLTIDLRIVRALAAQAGAPDLGAVRSALQRLQAAEVVRAETSRPEVQRSRRRARAPRPRAPAESSSERDHPAISVSLRLSLAARDRDQVTIGALLAGLDHEGLRTVVLTLAAMLPPDTDPVQALEWVDLPPTQWSDDTIRAEAHRWDAGARDTTAVTAHDLRTSLRVSG